ncbi:hypothetical protein BGZ47_005822 [Haplosporangium gracile]|nr:hypothetical protein BGZ47_005822 [Haplosporangium gracile]
MLKTKHTKIKEEFRMTELEQLYHNMDRLLKIRKDLLQEFPIPEARGDTLNEFVEAFSKVVVVYGRLSPKNTKKDERNDSLGYDNLNSLTKPIDRKSTGFTERVSCAFSIAEPRLFDSLGTGQQRKVTLQRNESLSRT